MKTYHRFLFAIFVFIFSSSVLSAQNLFLKFGGGYNLPMAGATTASRMISKSYPEPEYTNIAQVADYSFGKGVNFGIAAGWMFNKNIGVSLDANYLIGANRKVYYNQLTNLLYPC